MIAGSVVTGGFDHRRPLGDRDNDPGREAGEGPVSRGFRQTSGQAQGTPRATHEEQVRAFETEDGRGILITRDG
jgi:hypothetical protein